RRDARRHDRAHEDDREELQPPVARIIVARLSPELPMQVPDADARGFPASVAGPPMGQAPGLRVGLAKCQAVPISTAVTGPRTSTRRGAQAAYPEKGRPVGAASSAEAVAARRLPRPRFHPQPD